MTATGRSSSKPRLSADSASAGEGVTVQHIGSTYMPSLASKPIVDFLILVDEPGGLWVKPALDKPGRAS
jgi:GrpB-like predicted nucleotidyltransferase (UPF0157 family)